MDTHLEERYLNWLYSQIGSTRRNQNRTQTHWALARQMYRKEFIWLVPNDDNRVEDGRDLRYEFLNEHEIPPTDVEWLSKGCSFLEMLIGLSRRLSFEADGEPRVWFWHLVEQLKLERYNDNNYDTIAERKIDEALDRVIWRQYAPDGRGGLFPLNNPDRDQREVELWYQLSAYLLELL